jgi:hypothetical protein
MRNTAFLIDSKVLSRVKPFGGYSIVLNAADILIVHKSAEPGGLIEEISGQIQFENNNGMIITITFKIDLLVEKNLILN